MKKLAEKYRLQIRGTSGEHSEAKDGVHDISHFDALHQLRTV